MNESTLDTRLANDCIVLGNLDISLLLLMNNSLVPWFILVPETTEYELIDLSHSDQARLLKEINQISGFIRINFDCTKLNVAAIGNVVKQLHIHIVGRSPNDFCWPNVVWGTTEKMPYSEEKISQITASLLDHLGDQFTAKT